MDPDEQHRATRTRWRPRKPRSRWWAAAAAAGSALLLTSCQLPAFGAYPGSTTQGHDSFKLWQGFFVAGLVVFVIVFVLILWAVLRYRRKSDAMPPQTQYHTLFEIVYTIIPILIVLTLFGFTFVTENNVDAVTKQKMTVNVTAFQWGWQFQYPGYHVRVLGIETQDPAMVLPVGETVRIYLRSADVVHGFYVPAFDFSRYAQPGVTNQFNFHVTHTGTFRGQCTQYCGLYHSLMYFQVKAVTPAQFSRWVDRAKRSPTSTRSLGGAKQKIKQQITNSATGSI
ncbi:MAG: cytochrome c oxidase subunit II [Acidimicrobiales bacterium]